MFNEPKINFPNVMGKMGMPANKPVAPTMPTGPGGANPRDVVNAVKHLLDKMPEVEKASGTMTVKVKGQMPKTLSFKYN